MWTDLYAGICRTIENSSNKICDGSTNHKDERRYERGRRIIGRTYKRRTRGVE